jgi:HEAT repeat protein
MNEIEKLIADLDSGDKATQWNANIAIHEMGKEAVPFLIAALEKDAEKSQFISLLSGIGEDANAAIPLLMSLLEKVDLQNLMKNKGPNTQRYEFWVAGLITALGRIDRDGKSVSLLARFLEDDNYLCQCAAHALVDMKNGRAIPPLLNVLRDHRKSWVQRQYVVRALPGYGDFKPIVDALKGALNYDVKNSGDNWNEKVRVTVEESIRYIQFPEQFPQREKSNNYRGDDPAREAEQFAFFSKLNGFHFDFSLQSLEKEVDRYLEKIIRENGTTRDAKGDAAEKLLAAEISLTAYIGETIKRLYGGRWAGPFDKSFSGGNFYTFSLMIGKYEFFPSHFVDYYLTNGKESEGMFYDYLHGRKSDESGGLLARIEKGKL